MGYVESLGWASLSAWVALGRGRASAQERLPPELGPLLDHCGRSRVAVGEGVLPSLGEALLGSVFIFLCDPQQVTQPLWAPGRERRAQRFEAIGSSQPVSSLTAREPTGSSCWRGGWWVGWEGRRPQLSSAASLPPLGGRSPPFLSLRVLPCRVGSLRSSLQGSGDQVRPSV